MRRGKRRSSRWSSSGTRAIATGMNRSNWSTSGRFANASRFDGVNELSRRLPPQHLFAFGQT